MLMDISFHNFSYQLSDEDNRNLFGKCNNPNGHGHNYKGKISWQIFITTMTLGVLYIGMFYFRSVVHITTGVKKFEKL